jgi:hypothetical protein
MRGREVRGESLPGAGSAEAVMQEDQGRRFLRTGTDPPGFEVMTGCFKFHLPKVA